MASKLNLLMVMSAPMMLILVIRWLSFSNTNNTSAFFSGGRDPLSIHRVWGLLLEWPLCSWLFCSWFGTSQLLNIVMIIKCWSYFRGDYQKWSFKDYRNFISSGFTGSLFMPPSRAHVRWHQIVSLSWWGKGNVVINPSYLSQLSWYTITIVMLERCMLSSIWKLPRKAWYISLEDLSYSYSSKDKGYTIMVWSSVTMQCKALLPTEPMPQRMHLEHSYICDRELRRMMRLLFTNVDPEIFKDEWIYQWKSMPGVGCIATMFYMSWHDLRLQ